MITCEQFRARFAPKTSEPAVLEHLRSCDACLDDAAQIDPDVMFRAIGGGELIPPGGVDAFAADVMREVRLRETESTMHTQRALTWPQRLAIAATIVIGISTSLLVWQRDKTLVEQPPVLIAGAAVEKNLVSKPAVESYDSANATILEVPAESADVKIVMVFDDNLPADL